jgi:hypothetical protein
MSQKAQLSERLANLEKEAAEIKFLLKKSTGNIRDRIKEMADVYAEAGVREEDVIPYPNPINAHQKWVNAFAKVSLICLVLNEGWAPNWQDSSEYKYYPWFDMRKAAGWGFSALRYDVDNTSTYTTVGSRLCYKSSELAIYAGDRFEQEYFEYMNK